MPLKVFHTGDVHLGMTFRNRGYPEPVRESLVEARFTALSRLVELANREECQLFLVAGDLFHRNNVSREAVLKALEILSRFKGNCVAVLPGNHDFWDEFSPMWKYFQEHAFDNAIILSDTAPYDLKEFNLDLVLYPAPCHSKHSGENSLGWLKVLRKRPAARWHLGVAHGSVKGVSLDFDSQYFPMEEEELKELRLHHWCLGHTHVRYPDLEVSRQAVFTYCGTPEPDGFDCSHEGYARITLLDDQGNLESRSIVTGRFSFREIRREIASLEDLRELSRELSPGGENTLLRLALSGSLSREEYSQRQEIYQDLRDSLAYLEVDDSALALEITPATIAAEFTEGSFPYLLLTRLAERGEKEALQVAYQLVKKVKR